MADTVEALRRVPLLASLGDEELARLARGVKERRVEAGREIVKQGEGGIAFFVILDGEATVYVDGRERRTLGPGDHFGETSLVIPDEPRSATVTAKSELRLGAMSAWEFRPLAEENPKVVWGMLETLARRLADTPGA